MTSYRNIKQLLDTYPRRRPLLSEQVKQIFENEYEANLCGRGVASRLSKLAEQWMHKRVARPNLTRSILELGAGTLNHVQYENALSEYDAVEPRNNLYASSQQVSKIRSIYSNVYDIPDKENYDRVISIAVLEHLQDLPFVLARCGLLLKQNGIFQAGIPAEGEFLWYLGWKLTTGLSFKLRHGLDYGEVMRHEHVNTASDIINIIKYIYVKVKILRYPIPLQHLSLYVYIEASQPRIDVCTSLIESFNHKS